MGSMLYSTSVTDYRVFIAFLFESWLSISDEEVDDMIAEAIFILNVV